MVYTFYKKFFLSLSLALVIYLPMGDHETYCRTGTLLKINTAGSGVMDDDRVGSSRIIPPPNQLSSW